jgi:DNA-binding winged helix-turn-helix (wHTH) protein
MPGDLADEPALDYHFGPYRFDGRLRRLYKEGEPVVLTPKAVDTLAALIARAGRVVEKDELMSLVWNDVSVGDDTLAQNISTLRKVLGDDANAPRFIATVPRRGYRFVAPVRLGPVGVAGPERGRQVEAAVQRARWHAVALASGGALAVAAAAALAVWWHSAGTPPRSPVEFTIPEPESAKFGAGGNMLALSPDGKYLTFLANEPEGLASIWLRSLDSTTARRMNGTEGAIQMFWSPDSRSIAFFAERRLKAVDIASGAVRVIATLASPRALGGTWGRTGQILFSVPGDGLFVVPATGGSPEHVPSFDPACVDCANWPHFLPDGRRFLYTVASSDPLVQGIYVGELGSPGGRRVLETVSSATFIPPNLVSYVSEGTLYGQRVDPATLKPMDAPIPLADGVASNIRTGRAVAATSEAGVLAFRRPLITELVWVDRAGNAIGAAAPADAYLDFSIAPNGEQVAASRLDQRTGVSDIWVFGPGRIARVTDDEAWDAAPVWSADGQHLVYASRRGGRWRIYRRPAMAVGSEDLLLDASAPVLPTQVLQSGDLIYTSRQTHGLWRLSSKGAAPVIPGVASSDARLSSDERWLAYGYGSVYVSGLPFDQNRRPIAEGGSAPRWRSDGRELFYLSRELTIVSVPVHPPRTPGEAAGRPLFRGSDHTQSGIYGQVYDVAPDGQRFLLKRETRSSPIHVVLNWDARLTTH